MNDLLCGMLAEERRGSDHGNGENFGVLAANGLLSRSASLGSDCERHSAQNSRLEPTTQAGVPDDLVPHSSNNTSTERRPRKSAGKNAIRLQAAICYNGGRVNLQNQFKQVPRMSFHTPARSRPETVNLPIQGTRILSAATLLLGICWIGRAAAADHVDFGRDIRPLISDRCGACHGPDDDQRMAELRLDIEAGARADLGGYAAIVPGEPEESEMFRRLTTDDVDEVMPPQGKGARLSATESELVRRWIEQGGKYETHWSHAPPTKAALPKPVANAINEIDLFLFGHLESVGLSRSPPADRYTLARRVALDLTGLPPTWEEVESFVRNQHPTAYSDFVDALLQKPAFGEHWAQAWLDLARYADSSGYPSDQPREIWGYRDWVIRSLNSNQPFDQFTIDQIAGDLLPNPTDDQLIATAFHRNTMTQNEGGTSDEEFRVAAIVDRVNTTMAVWMGTTMACAQCHTHKFDPITQREYFELFAILNQCADADRMDEAPLHKFFTAQQNQTRQRLQAEIAVLEAGFASPPAEALGGPEERKASLTLLTEQLAQIKPASVPIMSELPEKERRETRVMRRGNWMQLGEKVGPAVPSAFHALPGDVAVDRLALAEWLVSRDNPLTARVIVNRFWESIFGIGIVRTSEDFGLQGELPIHPELLDWLAVDFMESGWNVKRLLKQLVMSYAYRQDSRSTPELNERDPDNRLLARGPRFRPTGELLRDQVLFASGLLSDKLGGPAVRPLAPNLGLTTAFGRSNDWTPSEGEDRHRRSVYTEVRRNSPYASFSTFDGPNREVCTIRRGRTNTPLQAFVTLNDPVFVEAHQALARRIVSESTSGSVLERLQFAFRVCLSRDPLAIEVSALTEFFEVTVAGFRDDLKSAKALAAESPEHSTDESDIAELAAWTAMANIIMNLDEFLMRR